MAPALMRFSVWYAARLARTARPKAPPIINAVLTIPEARPESFGETSLIALNIKGLKAIPPPMPRRIMLGKTLSKKVPSAGAIANKAREVEARIMPTMSGFFVPNFITTFADRPIENAPIMRFVGRKERPT